MSDERVNKSKNYGFCARPSRVDADAMGEQKVF
jgi:hypothetical protein